MPLYRESGVVLRGYKLRETDRIIVLMTPGRGKVRAVAKGVRKVGSRFGGRLEPGTHVQLLVYEGKDLDTISQAEAVEHFGRLWTDLQLMRDGLALLEAVDQVAQEGEANPQLFEMLLGALRTLERRPSPLVVAGFYWKLLALDGSAPMLDACVSCGRSGQDLEVAVLDLTLGGVVCRVCRPVSGDRHAITPEALEIIGRILGGDLAGALQTPEGPLAAEVRSLAIRALETHLERRLRVPYLSDGR